LKKKKEIYTIQQTKYIFFIRLRNIIQVRCGLSGINEEKNVDTAVNKTRVVLI
jgi:hypothetical protein